MSRILTFRSFFCALFFYSTVWLHINFVGGIKPYCAYFIEVISDPVQNGAHHIIITKQ